jgi:hypothetical protein
MVQLTPRAWGPAEPLALRVFAIQDSLRDTLARVTAGQLATMYRALTGQRRAVAQKGFTIRTGVVECPVASEK